MTKEERKEIMFELRDEGKSWFYIRTEFGLGKTFMEKIIEEYDAKVSPFIFLKDVTKRTLKGLHSTNREFLQVIKRKKDRLYLYTKCNYCLENEWVGHDMYGKNSAHKPCRYLLKSHAIRVAKNNTLHGDKMYTTLIGTR